MHRHSSNFCSARGSSGTGLGAGGETTGAGLLLRDGGPVVVDVVLVTVGAAVTSGRIHINIM